MFQARPTRSHRPSPALRLTAALAGGLTLGAGPLQATDATWPGFRGPNGSGVAATAKPPLAPGPTNHVQWKAEVPWSPSSPAVSGDRLFLTTFHEGRLETRAYASPVAADGRLYLASLQGRLTVVRAGGNTPEILYQANFGERIDATPAIVGDRLYLRTKTRLYAFGPG